MIDLSTKTSEIVMKRREKSKNFATMEVNINHAIEKLFFIQNLIGNSLWKKVIVESKVENEWQYISSDAKAILQDFNQFVSKEGAFSLAKSRADREYVNVGAIGIMREGKSEFIAQTTKLDKWILPRKHGEHACTTTSINVINGQSVDGKTNFARVYYYTVVEMRAIFCDYLEELGGDKNIISSSITTRKDLEKWCNDYKGIILKDPNIGNDKSKLKEKFIEYLSNIDDFVNRLIETPNDDIFDDYKLDDVISGNEIGKKYYSSISYYDNPDASEKTVVYDSFATKQADIFTSFEVDNQKVENIQFLDTPGIGEQKVGIDKILSDAVAMNLDIIVAIRAISGHPKEEAEQKFFNVLRNRLNGKSTAKDWVYYILNIWDGMKYNEADVVKNKIISNLATTAHTTTIALDDNHFSAINLLRGFEVKEGDLTDSNNPIGKFLYRIFTNLIPNIDKIDEEFYEDATLQLNKLNDRYHELVVRVKKLKLNSYDAYDGIQSLIGILQDELTNEGAKNPNIMQTIKHSIDEFCKQSCGTLVGKVFGIQKIDDIECSDSLCEKYEDKIKLGFDLGSYRQHTEFITYNNLKEKLCKEIEYDIKGRINQTMAEEKLKEIKNSVAKVFIDKGKMSFVSTEPSKWFDKMMILLETEAHYPLLYSIISDFANYTIDAKAKIEPRVITVTSICTYHDDFGDPEDYDFQEYSSAMRTVIHSLYAIEKYAKGLINEELVKRDIEQMQVTFDNVYFRLTKFAANTDPNRIKAIRNELYHFYENHSVNIFKGEEVLQKQGLVVSWKNKFL